MPGAVSDSKDPKKQRAGRVGARRRWGDPGVVQLDQLTPPQRRLVLALVQAAKSEAAAAIEVPAAATSEVRDASARPAN